MNLINDFIKNIIAIENPTTGRRMREKKSLDLYLSILIYFLPLLYFFILIINIFFNTYSSATWFNTFIIFTISLLLALIYHLITSSFIKILFKNTVNKKNYKIISATMVFLPAIFITISLFISLFIGLILNVYLIFLTFCFLFTISISLSLYINSKIIKTIDIKISKPSYAIKMIIILLLFIINPVFLISIVPIKLSFIDIIIAQKSDMKPTIGSNNILLVDKFSGLFKKPVYKDIILIELPGKNTAKSEHKKNTTTYIKRVIGSPGDTINIKVNQQILRNNELIKEDYINDNYNNIICNLAYHCRNVSIDKNHYYLLGDNRNRSQDSRIWSAVNKKYFKGKIIGVIWPKSNLKLFQ